MDINSTGIIEKSIGLDEIVHGSKPNSFTKEQNEWLDHLYSKSQNYNLFRKNYFELKSNFSKDIILTYLKGITMAFVTKYISFNSEADFELVNQCFSSEDYYQFIYKINGLFDINPNLKKFVQTNSLLNSYYKDSSNLEKTYLEILSILAGINIHDTYEDKLCGFVHGCWCVIYCTNDVEIDSNLLNLDIKFDLVDELDKEIIKEKITIVRGFIL